MNSVQILNKPGPETKAAPPTRIWLRALIAVTIGAILAVVVVVVGTAMLEAKLSRDLAPMILTTFSSLGRELA